MWCQLYGYVPYGEVTCDISCVVTYCMMRWHLVYSSQVCGVVWCGVVRCGDVSEG